MIPVTYGHQSPLRHGCSPVSLLYISGTVFPENTSGRPLLLITFDLTW